MLHSYYQIPVPLKKFFTTGNKTLLEEKEVSISGKMLQHSKNIKESISKHLDVLLLSRYGENRADHFYGLELWNHEFESKDLDSGTKERLIGSVIKTIATHEKRIDKIRVDEFYFTHKEIKIQEKILLLYVLNIEINAQIREESLTRINKFRHKMEIPVKVFYRHKS
jgi:predicted component of type VI protein secretion system